MKRFVAIISSVLLLAGVLSHQAHAQTSAPGGKPYRVAMILGTSGFSAAAQQAIVQGARAAAKITNSQGGILGRPVEITVFDSQGDPARSVRILQQEVLTTQWDLIYPGGGAANTGPMLPFIARAKVLAMSAYLDPKQGDPTDNPYFFNVLPNSQDVAAGFAHYISTQGVTKLGILYPSDAYGQTSVRTLEPELKKLVIPSVSEAFNVGTIDITPTLLRLQNQAPSHVFGIAFGAPAGHILNSMDKLGWNVPLIGDVAFSLADLPSVAPARSYEKLIVQSYRINAWQPLEKRSARFNNFLNAVKAEGPITQGLFLYSVGWDTIMLAALAAKKANSTELTKMVQALESLKLPPEQRTYVSYDEYNFSPKNHEIQAGPSEFSFVPYTRLTEGMVGKK